MGHGIRLNTDLSAFSARRDIHVSSHSRASPSAQGFRRRGTRELGDGVDDDRRRRGDGIRQGVRSVTESGPCQSGLRGAARAFLAVLASSRGDMRSPPRHERPRGFPSVNGGSSGRDPRRNRRFRHGITYPTVKGQAIPARFAHDHLRHVPNRDADFRHGSLPRSGGKCSISRGTAGRRRRARPGAERA